MGSKISGGQGYNNNRCLGARTGSTRIDVRGVCVLFADEYFADLFEQKGRIGLR